MKLGHFGKECYPVCSFQKRRQKCRNIKHIKSANATRTWMWCSAKTSAGASLQKPHCFLKTTGEWISCWWYSARKDWVIEAMLSDYGRSCLYSSKSTQGWETCNQGCSGNRQFSQMSSYCWQLQRYFQGSFWPPALCHYHSRRAQELLQPCEHIVYRWRCSMWHLYVDIRSEDAGYIASIKDLRKSFDIQKIFKFINWASNVS